MDQFVAISRALGDESRLRTLIALHEQELCVCQVTELLGLAPSTVSKHLAILKQAGLVESRKSGRWIHYRIPGGEIPSMARNAIAFVRRSIAEHPRAIEDRERLRQILKTDPEELCLRQRLDAESAPGADEQKVIRPA